MLPKIIVHEEWFSHLVDELQAIRSETFKTLVEQDLQGRWLAGELIKTNKKAVGRYEDIAKALNISKETVEDWVWFYKQFPEKSWDEAYMKLPDCNGKLNFSRIKKSLNYKLPEDCEHDYEPITKWKCRKCGVWTADNPNLLENEKHS